MLTWTLWGTWALLGSQTLLMSIDELYFHRRRGLDRLEAWGHALDTTLFLAPVVVAGFATPSSAMMPVFVALALLSTLAVTKDEWLHAKACEPGEHWLHSLLFVLHGPLLIGVGYCWINGLGGVWLKALPFVVASWGLMQLFYWNLPHANRDLGVGEQRLLRRSGRPLVSR